MKCFAHLLTVLLAASANAAGTGDVIRTAAELRVATFDRRETGRRFDIVVKLATPYSVAHKGSFAAEDESGAVQLWKEHADREDCKRMYLPAGTKARAKGFIDTGRRSKRSYANCQTLEPISTGPAPTPTPVSARDFLSGRYDCRLVMLRGKVLAIVTDEIDPKYQYLIISVDGESITIPFLKSNPSVAKLSIGTEIEVSGVCSLTNLGMRRQIGRLLDPSSATFKILSEVKEPFGAPLISDFMYLRPQDIAALGRQRAIGHVIAAWQGDNAILKCDGERLVRIETDKGGAPRYGNMIEAVGFPESDLYRVNLSRAIWRKVQGDKIADETPREVTAEELLVDTEGRRRFNPYAYGHAIRLCGIVRNMPGEGNVDGRFNIESGKFIVPVDTSATPGALDGLSVGCEVSVAGTCVMEIDNWRPNLPFPAIRGFFVVVRRPSDVTVLSRPSWWTPPRLAAVVGILALVLVGSLVWNALLKHLAERRGRELAKTAIAKAESDLKVDERTRLAVELHDSISQNLTGISLAIRAAERLLATDTDGTRGNLKLASTSLDSCRQELKNCLWDLRNSALDEADMNEAIRQTLAPHIGDAELSVRFNMPREMFTDKTAHAILHIVRELATNSVRHGHATHIRVAGSIDGDTLRFSVRDDGRGFDPSACPGMDEGHFGLQGVRERVNNLEGEMSIESEPGKGSKVSIAIKISHSSQHRQP